MGERRIQRLNSLLREVISDVIRKEVKNPRLPRLTTITYVEITKDLRYAKVYVSVLGDENVKKEAIAALQSAAGFIAIQASKEVVMRYFPELTFFIDNTVEKQNRINELITEIQTEREAREPDES